MTIKTAVLFFAMVAIGLVVGGTANAGLITNGSFESGVDPGSFTTLDVGSSSITGWDVTTPNIDYIGSYWQASDGSRSLDLNGFFLAGGISQTLSGLTIGRTYQITFDMAGNPDNQPDTKTLGVSAVGTNTNVSSGYSFSILPHADHTRSNMGWVTKSFSFKALDSSIKLSFYSTTVGDGPGVSAWGPALDNVSAVPEPSSMALLGLGGMALTAYRRRRASAV